MPPKRIKIESFDRVFWAGAPKGQSYMNGPIGRRIHFTEGVSEVLVLNQRNWAITNGNVKLVPFAGQTLEKGAPKATKLPPPPPPSYAEEEARLAQEAIDNPPPPEEIPEETLEGGADGETGKSDESYPGESQKLENITEYNAKDAAGCVKDAETLTVLAYYEAQENTLGEKVRKKVLAALEKKKAELQEALPVE